MEEFRRRSENSAFFVFFWSVAVPLTQFSGFEIMVAFLEKKFISEYFSVSHLFLFFSSFFFFVVLGFELRA
jgi:hypothetical protein